MAKTSASRKKPALHTVHAAAAITVKAKEKKAASAPKPAESEPDFRSRVPLIIAVVVLVLIVAGVFWWFRPVASTTYDYRGFPFTKDNCPGAKLMCYYANLKINGEPYVIPFERHPTDVDTIHVDYDALVMLRATRSQPNATVIIGVPNGAPAQVGVDGAQLSRILGERYGILNFTIVAGVTGSGANEVDCRYATPHQEVILFQQQTPEGVYVVSDNCVEFRAANPDRLGFVVDAYVYRILGIIPTLRPVNATAKPPVTPSPLANASLPLGLPPPTTTP